MPIIAATVPLGAIAVGLLFYGEAASREDGSLGGGLYIDRCRNMF